jgi:hypothetical protein
MILRAPLGGRNSMLSKISIAAAVALVAALAVPNASFAATKKHKSPASTSECLGGGCTAKNPDRTANPCSTEGGGTSCYKRSKAKKTEK